MHRKIVLLLVSCLMAVSLVLASCAPAVVEEEEKAPVVEEKKEEVKKEEVVAPEKKIEMMTVTLTKSDGTKMTKTIEKPQYGGTYIIERGTSSAPWDEALRPRTGMNNINIVAEDLIIGDWAKGMAGTEETMWQNMGFSPIHLTTGGIAESWEHPDEVTFIFHIQKGVHFHNKPPANGREVTADDVVYCLNRNYTVPTSYILLNAPKGHIPEFKALDRYTVEAKCPHPETAPFLFEYFASMTKVVPPEVIEKYGDMSDWRNVCGTGPFIVIDQVDGASSTFVRNPTYWKDDPVTGMRLPYLDGVRWLVIPDTSTKIAAMRTHKLDLLRNAFWEDGLSLLSSNPELKHALFPYLATYCLFMRTDREPYNDIRVRQAMSMAVDQPQIAEEYFGGYGDTLAHPILPRVKDFADLYIPLEEMPQVVQDIHGYNPEKARQLLAEAGYPDGFKTEVLFRTGRQADDLMTIVQANLADVGIELKLDSKSSAVYTSAQAHRKYDHMIWTYGSPYLAFEMVSWRPGTSADRSYVDDPRTNEVIAAVEENYYNYDEKVRLIREWQPYALEQAWYINIPNPVYFYLWQPYVHNFHGEYSLGMRNYFGFIPYLWIDTELKKEITGGT